MWIRTQKGKRINAHYLMIYCVKDLDDSFEVMGYDSANDMVFLGRYRTQDRANRALESLDYAIVHEPNMYTMLEDAED